MEMTMFSEVPTSIMFEPPAIETSSALSVEPANLLPSGNTLFSDAPSETVTTFG